MASGRGAWVTPASDTEPYLQNLENLSKRLREAAKIAGDHGLRLGLEYIGTKRSWRGRKYTFVHSLAEAEDLIAAIGTGNVGVVLDSWHWWQADDTVEDLLTLTNEQVVSADLNDAPPGLAKEDHYDNQRELPMATGVIWSLLPGTCRPPVVHKPLRLSSRARSPRLTRAIFALRQIARRRA